MARIKRKPSGIIINLCWLLLTYTINGQQFPVHNYTVKDGLISNNITCFMQDSQGFMWFGTSEGLSCFDGTAFSHITKDDGLPSSYITCLLETRQRPAKIFIGTRRGLCVMSDKLITVHKINSIDRENAILNICEDNSGRIWCGTVKGIYQYADGRFTMFRDTAFFGYIGNLIYQQANSRVIINSDKGIFLYDILSNSLTKIQLTLPSKTDYIASIQPMNYGTIIAISHEGWLARLSGKPHILTRVTENLTITLLKDTSRYFYLTTVNGLYRFTINGGSIGNKTRYTTADGLPNNDVRFAFIDREENLWLSTMGYGLVRVSLDTYVRFPLKENSGRYFVDKREHVWIGESRVLNEYWSDNYGEWKTRQHQIISNQPGWTIWNAIIDNNQRVWIIAGNPGVKSELRCYQLNIEGNNTQIARNPIYRLSTESGFPAPDWMSLLADSDNLLWYSSLPGGLGCIDISNKPKLLYTLSEKDGLGEAGIYMLYENSRHELWGGGWNKSITVIKKKGKYPASIKSYTEKEGLPDTYIRAIGEDFNGRMIIGTVFGGVSVFNGHGFKNYSFKDGLPCNQICSITATPDSNVYIGTISGIIASKMKPNFSFRWLKDFQGDIIKSMGIVGGNTLWLVNQASVIIFPGRFNQRPAVGTPLLIRKVSANNIDVKPDSVMTFAYSQNDIRIEFAAVTFKDVNVNYKYSLDYPSMGWQPLGTQHYVHFPALESGIYHFRLQAFDQDDLPVSGIREVTIIIQPPFWSSGWFIAIIILLGITVVWSVFYWSISRYRKRQTELLNLIADKENAEVELKQSQELFSIINNGVMDLIAIVDLNGRRMYSSKSYERMFGDTSMLVGTDSFREIHPEDRDRIMHIFNETVRTGIGQRTDFRFILPDNSIRYIESQGSIIMGADGKPSKVIIVSRDISERKQYEETLLLLNQSLEQKVLERTQDLMESNEKLQNEIGERERKEQEEHSRIELILSHRNVLLELAKMDKSYFDLAVETILKRTAETLNADKAGYWIPSDTDNQFICKRKYDHTKQSLVVEDAKITPPYTLTTERSATKTPGDDFNVTGDEGREAFKEYARKSGAASIIDIPVWFHGNISGFLILEYHSAERSFNLEEEEFVSSVSTMISLTIEAANRMSAEKSLRTSEEQYRILVENANESIIVTQDELIKYANPKTAELSMYSIEELTKKHFVDFIHPDDREMVFVNYKKRLSGDITNNNYCFRIINKQKQVRVVEINAVKIVWENKPATLNFLTDITERKRVDDELRYALEKERELSEIRARFISMASHEFRTPLTAILTSSEILENFQAQLTDDMRKNNFQRIQDNVRYMTRILNDILFLGRSDAGKLILKPEPVKLDRLCGEVIEQVQLFIMNSGSGHKINAEYSKADVAAILDYTLMRQLLENLLSNAVKYSPGKPEVFFSCVCDGKRVKFEIRDEGIGIPEEDIRLLFEPFHRGKNVGNISGTGLGLAIVKRAVELHEGSINIDSKTDTGTTVTIILPLRRADIYE